MTIIDVSYVKTNTINMALEQLAIDNTKRLEKLIANIEKKVLLYIDTSSFSVGDGGIVYPENLKEVVLFLVESYFIVYGTGGREAGTRLKKSEKIDDYSYSTEIVRDNAYAPLYFYEIPITKEYLDILNLYAGTTTFGFGNFEILG